MPLQTRCILFLHQKWEKKKKAQKVEHDKFVQSALKQNKNLPEK